MPECANIILCSAEPGWYKAEAKGDAYRTLSYAAQIATNAGKDLRIPLVLSGDFRHYARYVGDGGHYMTSGGEGARSCTALSNWSLDQGGVAESAKEKSTLAACTQPRTTSEKLLKGNWHFGRLNRGLTLALSGLYLACSFVLTYAWRLDVGIAIFMLLLAGLWGYSRYQEGGRKKTAIPSIAHALVHMAVIAGFSWAILWANRVFSSGHEWHWLAWLIALAIPTFLLGPWLSGKIMA